MKKFVIVFILLFLKANAQNEICWQGKLNDKTPVFIHYSNQDEIVIGEIIYLNTKNKTPIQIIGIINEQKNIRLLEFEKDGNVSGIIDASVTEKELKGDWFSPKSRKSLTFNATKKDTIIKSKSYIPIKKAILGSYHYQYSNKGSQGNLDLKNKTDNNYSFLFQNVTSDPARNLADLDGILKKESENVFSYSQKDEYTKCDIKLFFYKDFLYVKYTNGDCEGFGHNATIDGFYRKIK